MGSLIPLAIVLIVLCLVVGVLSFENRQAKKWEVVAEGVYDHIEYGYYEYSRRSGAMVHTTTYHRMDVTAVYFTDGRTCVMDGRKDMAFPSGTPIRISQNGLGRHKIERREG